MSSRRKILYFSVPILILIMVVVSAIYIRHIRQIQNQFWRDQMKEFIREIKPGMTDVEVMAIIDKKPWRNRAIFNNAEFVKYENVIRVTTPVEFLGRNWVVILYFNDGKIARTHIGEFTNTKEKPDDAPNDINFVSP